MKKSLSIFVAAILVVGGGSFYGGMKYAQSKAPQGRMSQVDFQNLSPEERQQRIRDFGTNVGGARLRQGFGGQGGFAAGEVISKDDSSLEQARYGASKSVTVKLQNGGSRIIFLSDKTEITKSVKGLIQDLAVGKQITANGSANQDGSISAQSIQIRDNPRTDNSRPQ